jgi:two-component system KDP operon response regulator KdpE
LTPTEWKFIGELFKAKGALVSQSEILHKVWGSNYEKESHYLRLFMSQLRKKLEPNPSKPKYLITEPGRGYRLISGSSK